MKKRALDYFDEYLSKIKHSHNIQIILFYDPGYFSTDIIDAFREMNAMVINARICNNAYETVKKNHRKNSIMCIFEFTVETIFPKDKSNFRYIEKNHTSAALTTLELPRYNLTQVQVTETLERWLKDSPFEHLKIADSFFEKLEMKKNPYSLKFITGKQEVFYKLTVEDISPIMEISGPLEIGDIRFAPAAELYYGGNQINGSLLCNRGALSILPFRSINRDEKDLYENILYAGKMLKDDSVLLTIQAGTIISIESENSYVEKVFNDILFSHYAFTSIVEVGIGLSTTSFPLIYNWGATSNEASLGMHLGIGADPTNANNTTTKMHFDFICPQVQIMVNDQLFYNNIEPSTAPRLN